MKIKQKTLTTQLEIIFRTQVNKKNKVNNCKENKLLR